MHDTKVKDIMTNLVVTLRASDQIHEAAARLARNNISGAPVTDGGKLVGIISESDLIRATLPPVRVSHGASPLEMMTLLFRARAPQRVHGKTVGDVMTPIVTSVKPDDATWTAATLMESRGLKRLPVVDDEGFVVGIVSRADLVRLMARSDEDLKKDVIEAISMLGTETIEGLEAEVTAGVVTLDGTCDRRSTHDLAVKLAGRVPGIVEVVDRMDHERTDDISGHAPVKIDPRENWNPDLAVIEGRR